MIEEIRNAPDTRTPEQIAAIWIRGLLLDLEGTPPEIQRRVLLAVETHVNGMLTHRMEVQRDS